MVRHLLGSIWNHFKLITTDILTLVKFYRSDHKKWFTVGLVFIILLCSLYFLVHCTLSLYKDSSRNIKRILTYTTVPFWFSSILSSLGETKNPSLPVSFLSLARASIVADEVFHYDD